MQILQQLASIFFDSDHPNIERVEIQELGQHYREEIHPLFLDQIWVASAYIYTRDILERYKYHSEREYIEPLSRYLIALAEHADIRVEESSDWIIVPVPMHWSRYILRGFDHI